MDVSVFAEHTTQASALPEPSGTDRSNLRGQDWNFLSSSRGNTQTWLLMPLNLIAHPFHSFLSRYLTPLASVPSSHYRVGKSRQ